MDYPIPIIGGIVFGETDYVDEIAHLYAIRYIGHHHLSQPFEALIVQFGYTFPSRKHLFYALQLRDSQGTVDVTQTIVVAET